MYKSIGLQVRRTGLTHAEYVHHWLTVHAGMSVNVAALKGYVANEVVLAGDALALERTHPAFGATLDGIANLHIETEDGLKRMAEDPAVQTWFADGPNFVGLRTGFIAEEFVLQRPPRGSYMHKAWCFVQGLAAIVARQAPAAPPLAALQALTPRVTAGLVCSRLGAPTGSTNLAGFEVPPMDHALEVWGKDISGAVDAARALRAGLPAGVTLVGAVIAREYVVKLPPQ